MLLDKILIQLSQVNMLNKRNYLQRQKKCLTNGKEEKTLVYETVSEFLLPSGK